MLYTIAVILLIAWLLGIVGTYTIGAFIHVLSVVAIVPLLVGLAERATPGIAAQDRIETSRPEMRLAEESARSGLSLSRLKLRAARRQSSLRRIADEQ